LLLRLHSCPLKLPEAIKNPTFAGFDLEDCILSVRHVGRTKKKQGHCWPCCIRLESLICFKTLSGSVSRQPDGVWSRPNRLNIFKI